MVESKNAAREEAARQFEQEQARQEKVDVAEVIDFDKAVKEMKDQEIVDKLYGAQQARDRILKRIKEKDYSAEDGGVEDLRKKLREVNEELAIVEKEFDERDMKVGEGEETGLREIDPTGEEEVLE